MQKNGSGKLFKRGKVFDEQIAIDGVGQNVIGVKLKHFRNFVGLIGADIVKKGQKTDVPYFAGVIVKIWLQHL